MIIFLIFFGFLFGIFLRFCEYFYYYYIKNILNIYLLNDFSLISYGIIGIVFSLIINIILTILIKLSKKNLSNFHKLSLNSSLLWIIYIFFHFVYNINIPHISDAQLLRTQDYFLNKIPNILIFLTLAFFIIRVFYRLFYKFYSRIKGISTKLLLGILIFLSIFLLSITINQKYYSKIDKNEQKYPSIILFSVDALRADHLSCYGYNRKTSPNIDELSKSGISFTNCFCQIPQTAPSYATIFTSLYPQQHQLYLNQNYLYLGNNKIKTIAGILKEKGYITAAFLSGALPGTLCGLDHGFDTVFQSGIKVKAKYFDFLTILKNHLSLIRTIIDRNIISLDISPTTKEAIKWLERHKKNQFFIHIYWHYPHLPYTPPAKFARKFIKNADNGEPIIDGLNDYEIKNIFLKRSLYDGEIAYADYQFGLCMKKIKQLGLDNNSIIIFTADHGEEMGYRKWKGKPFFGHSLFVYDSTIKIPLIISYYNYIEKGLVNNNIARSLDIAPTILGLLNFDIPSEMEGVDLIGKGINKESSAYDKKIDFCFSFIFSYLDSENPNYLSIRNKKFKYIFSLNKKEELYNIIDDPYEFINLAFENQEVIKRFRNEIHYWESKTGKRVFPLDKINNSMKNIPERKKKLLKSLGYIK